MSVAIVRDRFGVPHIFADTLEEGLFGQGYAQAQDRLEAICIHYATAMGRSALLFGESRLEADYQKRVVDIPGKARKQWENLHPLVKKGLQAFCDGINWYMKEHSGRVPVGATEVKPEMVLALSIWIVFQWSYGQVLEELSQYQQGLAATGIGPDRPDSNQWAVGPGKSALNVPIRLIDPHVGWWGEYRWHECHLSVASVPSELVGSGRSLDVYGFAIPGLPGVALGFNRRLSWAATAGGPDTADAFLLRLSPDRKSYLYDGQWLKVEEERVVLPFKAASGTCQQERLIRKSHLGPIVFEMGDLAVCIRSAYDDAPPAATQMLKMASAQNLEEFLDALRDFAFPPQNLVVASADGDIYYLLNGRTPRRSLSYDFSRPVPGWTSETDWRGILALEELPHLKNPPDGFLQNCNNSPQFACPHSPLTPDRFPHYAYYSHAGPVYRARSDRCLELLSSIEKMTVDDALGVAKDTYLPKAREWIAIVTRALADEGALSPSLAAALDLLNQWSGRADKDERGAGLYFLFRWQYHQRTPGLSWDDDDKVPRTPEERERAKESLRSANEYVLSRFGDFVPLGHILRLRRIKTEEESDREASSCDLPVGGMQSFAADCLRAIWADGPVADGRFIGVGGQSCTTIVVHTDPPQAWSITPFGNSDDPESPHFVDQAPLFSAEEFKRVAFTREEVANCQMRIENIL